jgi:ABC-type hemin transport system ATPase subunit
MEAYTGVILLGGAGAGKTTVLRMLSLAVQTLADDHRESVRNFSSTEPYPLVLRKIFPEDSQVCRGGHLIGRVPYIFPTPPPDWSSAVYIP